MDVLFMTYSMPLSWRNGFVCKHEMISKLQMILTTTHYNLVVTCLCQS
jgi:hypothetical protein